jgi:hypothetical protein
MWLQIEELHVVRLRADVTVTKSMHLPASD